MSKRSPKSVEEKLEIVNYTIAQLLPMEKTIKQLLRSLVFLTNRFILGCVSLKKMVLKVYLIDVEKD